MFGELEVRSSLELYLMSVSVMHLAYTPRPLMYLGISSWGDGSVYPSNEICSILLSLLRNAFVGNVTGLHDLAI